MKKIITSAIITAAGNGTRFGRNKMISLVGGKTVLVLTVRQFAKAKNIDEIIVTAKKHDFSLYRRLLKEANLSARFVKGGEERLVSAYHGVLAAKGNYVVVHDGVRPFAPTALIEKVVEEVKIHNAVMTAVHPTATIKYASNGIIEKSFPRAETWIAQTPQAFRKDIIQKAYKEAIDKHYFVATDDSELVAMSGQKIYIVEGDPINIKITFPVDLVMAQDLFAFSKESLNVFASKDKGENHV